MGENEIVCPLCDYTIMEKSIKGFIIMIMNGTKKMKVNRMELRKKEGKSTVDKKLSQRIY